MVLGKSPFRLPEFRCNLVLESSGCGLGDCYSFLLCFVGLEAGTVFFSFFALPSFWSPCILPVNCLGSSPLFEYIFCCLAIKKKNSEKRLVLVFTLV